MNRMLIPFYKPSISGAEIQQIAESIKSSWLATGSQTRQFEQDFAQYLKHKHARAVASRAAGLHLALEAIELKSGQGVLVPTLASAVTAYAVQFHGGTPILVDCNPIDFNLDVADAEQRLQQAVAQGIQVVAILPNHFGGQIGDVPGVRWLAKKYQLQVIEDASECCPAFYREPGEPHWRTVGSGADLSCFSFHASQPLTTGEGGMVCTQREDYALRMKTLAGERTCRPGPNQQGRGQERAVTSDCTYDLNDLAAAIGSYQLRKADRLQMRRTRIAGHYEDLLSNIDEITLPNVHPDRIHSWNLFVIRLHLADLTVGRTEVMEELQQAGITARVHYLPLHMHRFYSERYGYAPDDLPGAALVYPEILSLPNYPDMAREEVEYVSENLKQIITRYRKSVHLTLVHAGDDDDAS